MKRSDAFPGRKIDRTEVIRAATLLFDPDDPHELRGVPSGQSILVSLADPTGIADAAQALSNNHGVYRTLNPVRRDIVFGPGLPSSRVEDILRRRWLLIDIDRGKEAKARCPDGSATQEEKDACWTTVVMVQVDLRKRGWPEPITVDSGNGYHLYYRIDLPSGPRFKDPSQKLLAAVLKALKAVHDTPDVQIDGGVHDAPRIAKMPGTWACKGPNTPDRPHRLAKMLDVPERIEVVTREQLEALAGPLPPERPETPHEDVAAKKQRRKAGGSDREKYLKKALDAEAGQVAMAPGGERNRTLNDAAFALGMLVEAGLRREDIESTLFDAARRCGFDSSFSESDVHKTIRSGIEAGLQRPREVPERPPSSYQRWIESHHQKNGTSVNFVKNVTTLDIGSPPEWRPPRLREIPGPTSFPLDVLPGSLAELCMQGAAAMQCPPDYFAVSALGAAAGAIGLSVMFQVKARYAQSAHLYMAICNPPGGRKSPAMSLMVRPLYEIDKALRQEYRNVLKDHSSEGPVPVLDQLTLDDVTVEAVAKVHADNPRGLILLPDELTGWVASQNAYRGGKGADKQFWLKVNTGSTVKVNRVKDTGLPILISHPCITVLGTLTPSTMPSLRADRRDDGWMDRILFSYPEYSPPLEWSEAVVSEDSLGEWSDAINHLWGRKMVVQDGEEPRPWIVTMTDPARLLWREQMNSHLAEAAEQTFPRRTMGGPWSKFEGFAARLALILSRLHQVYERGDEGQPHNVSPLDVWGAWKLIDYFKVQYRRARGELVGAEETTDEAQSILDWAVRHKRISFTGHDIRRHFPRFSPLVKDTTLRWLESKGCIRTMPDDPKESGKPGRMGSKNFEVSPYILYGDVFDKIDDTEDEPGSAG